MIVAAFGCNVAWRVVDAVFYLMHRFSEQGQGILRRILLILEPAGFWRTQVLTRSSNPARTA